MFSSAGQFAMTNDDDGNESRWARRCKMIDRACVSVRYHHKRERYFDAASKWITMLTAAAATSAVAAVLGRAEVANLAAAAVTAVLALVPLVLDPADKARRHSQLAAEFQRLHADAERAGLHWSEEACCAFTARLLDIEISEPASLNALITECQNEHMVATERAANVRPLRWYERLLKNLVSFDGAELGARSAALPG